MTAFNIHPRLWTVDDLEGLPENGNRYKIIFSPTDSVIPDVVWVSNAKAQAFLNQQFSFCLTT